MTLLCRRIGNRTAELTKHLGGLERRADFPKMSQTNENWGEPSGPDSEASIAVAVASLAGCIYAVCHTSLVVETQCHRLALSMLS